MGLFPSSDKTRPLVHTSSLFTHSPNLRWLVLDGKSDEDIDDMGEELSPRTIENRRLELET